jgi:Glycosyl transferase family 2
MGASALGEEAIWTSNASSYEAVSDAPFSVFLGPPVRGNLSIALARCASNPLGSAAAVARHAGPRDVLSFAAWLDTADVFRITRIVQGDGSVSPLTGLLRRPRRIRSEPAPSVGLAMMVQNEEKRLARCLSSVVDWVSEMVLVDGGSKDATVDIARSFGARVVVREFDGDYATQRNEGLKLIRAPWVLSLDADEILSPDLPPVLEQVASSGIVDGAYVHLLNQLDDDATPWFWPDRKMRFFKSGRLMAGRIHEKVQGIGRAAYLPLSGPYIRHNKSLKEQWDREKQYFDLDPSYYTAEDAERIQRWRSDGGESTY